MKDLKRISWLAIFLILVLRISIGWQFLYEGMWKYDQMDGPTPWSAEGYLKNAQGPFRDHFRQMTGDPDDLNWLDYEKMSQKWYSWRDRFVDHYKLNAEQQALLNILLDSAATEDTAPAELPPFPTFSRKLDSLPKSVNLDRYAGTVEYDPQKKVLTVLEPVLPSEESQIKEQVGTLPTDGTADQSKVDFLNAFEALVAESRSPIEKEISDLSRQAKAKDGGVDTENFNYAASRISSTVKKSLPYRHRLAASLLGDPDRVGVYGAVNERGSFDIEMGTVTRSMENEEDGQKHNIKFGKIKEYKKLLEEYETALKQAAIDYQYDHATMLGRKAAAMRAELVGPIRSLESELQDNALKMLTSEQLAYGAMPPEDTPLHRSNMAAMWGLLILGALLIVGLLTRFAAIAGAAMLLSFYLVIPPWPGVPPAPGPEHSLFINKNMIEVIALLAIAAMPTGTWFGIDAFFSRMFFKSPETATGEKSSA